MEFGISHISPNLLADKAPEKIIGRMSLVDDEVEYETVIDGLYDLFAKNIETSKLELLLPTGATLLIPGHNAGAIMDILRVKEVEPYTEMFWVVLVAMSDGVMFADGEGQAFPPE